MRQKTSGPTKRTSKKRPLTADEHLEFAEQLIARKGATPAKEKASILNALRHNIAASYILQGRPPVTRAQLVAMAKRSRKRRK